MQKKAKLILLPLILLWLPVILPLLAQAQGENNTWCFGAYTGIDFNTVPPTFFQHAMYTQEGCASISDPVGNLLFYANSGVVYNRQHNVMPNSYGILGNGPPVMGSPFLMQGSTMQGTAIVPSFSNPYQYYLFTLDDIMNPEGKLRYTLVDMSLDNGLGDVVAGQKNILVDSGMNEQMTVMPGLGCASQWIVVHKRSGTTYHTHHIDVNGVDVNAVVSPGSSSMAGGTLCGSPDGSIIANRVSGGIELASFNAATGVISDYKNLSTTGYATNFGLSFSPSGKRLYVGSMTQTLQFDLEQLPVIAAVNSSLTPIGAGMYQGMRITPDNRIFLVAPGNLDMACIQNPDALGTVSNFVPVLMTIPVINNAYSSHISLGMPVINIIADTIFAPVTDTFLCGAETAMLSAPAGYTAYRWSDGSTENHITVSEPGKVWVHAYRGCQLRIDTFVVEQISIAADLGNDTTICNNLPFLLRLQAEGATFRWSTGSTAQQAEVTAAGTYWVEVRAKGCKASDTIIVAGLDPFGYIVEEGRLTCEGEPVWLHGLAYPESYYSWNSGATTDSTLAINGMNYFTANNICGNFTDSVMINVEDCNCNTLIPNAFSPDGNGKNDFFEIRVNCTHTRYSCSIYNRYGQSVFSSSDSRLSWDGKMNGSPADVGVYFYRIKFTGRDGREHTKKGDLTLIR